MTAARAALILTLVASAAMAAQTEAREAGDARSGARLAKTYCGECHALGDSRSPLADAPPFATLNRRYPPGGGLDDLLSEGMIAPLALLEEGSRRFHPRMSQAQLDDDQIADLAAFLLSVQKTAPVAT